MIARVRGRDAFMVVAPFKRVPSGTLGSRRLLKGLSSGTQVSHPRFQGVPRLPGPTHSPAGRGGTMLFLFRPLGGGAPLPGAGDWEMGEGSGVRTPREAAPTSTR